MSKQIILFDDNGNMQKYVLCIANIFSYHKFCYKLIKSASFPLTQEELTLFLYFFEIKNTLR